MVPHVLTSAIASSLLRYPQRSVRALALRTLIALSSLDPSLGCTLLTTLVADAQALVARIHTDLPDAPPLRKDRQERVYTVSTLRDSADAALELLHLVAALPLVARSPHLDPFVIQIIGTFLGEAQGAWVHALGLRLLLTFWVVTRRAWLHLSNAVAAFSASVARGSSEVRPCFASCMLPTSPGRFISHCTQLTTPSEWTTALYNVTHLVDDIAVP